MNKDGSRPRATVTDQLSVLDQTLNPPTCSSGSDSLLLKFVTTQSVLPDVALMRARGCTYKLQVSPSSLLAVSGPVGAGTGPVSWLLKLSQTVRISSGAVFSSHLAGNVMVERGVATACLASVRDWGEDQVWRGAPVTLAPLSGLVEPFLALNTS